jgi:hypothetical protein
MNRSLLFVVAPILMSVSGAANAQNVVVPLVGIEKAGQAPTAEATLKTMNSMGASLLAGDSIQKIQASASDIQAVSQITCPPNKTGLTDGWNMFTYSLDKNAAADLNLYAKAEISASDRVVLYHFMWYKEIEQNGDVIGRCGSGVALALKISNFKSDMSVELPMLAANAQLGLASITYKLGTFGLSGQPIDRAAPAASAVGKFDTESYAALMRSVDQIQAAGADGTGVTFTPRLVNIVQPPPSDDGDTRSALIKTLVLGSIAKGTRCRDARALVPSRDTRTDALVDLYYKTFMRSSACSSFDQGPNQSEKNKAASELAAFKIQVN